MTAVIRFFKTAYGSIASIPLAVIPTSNNLIDSNGIDNLIDSNGIDNLVES